MKFSFFRAFAKELINKVRYNFNRLLNIILYLLGYYKLRLKHKVFKKNDLVVLAYHSVKNGPVKYSGLEVSINNFEDHLSLIRKYFDIITLDKAIDYLGNDPVKNKKQDSINF